jgi:hypothetical protein
MSCHAKPAEPQRAITKPTEPAQPDLALATFPDHACQVAPRLGYLAVPLLPGRAGPDLDMPRLPSLAVPERAKTHLPSRAVPDRAKTRLPSQDATYPTAPHRIAPALPCRALVTLPCRACQDRELRTAPY